MLYRYLSFKIIRLNRVFLSVLVESLLYITCKAHYIPKSKNWFDMINAFLEAEFNYVFKFINYNFYLGIILQVKK